MVNQTTVGNGESNRIKHALHHGSWSWGKDQTSFLKSAGQPVLTTEYEVEMKGRIFCPECCCPLYRSPEDEDANKRGRSAYFGHRRGIKTDCSLRTKPAIGKCYDSEEEAAQAVSNGDLVIIESFMTDRPETPSTQNGVYNETPVEDPDGEPASVPISRYRGRKFTLPSKISSIAGLCRNFDKNYYKYYFFPGAMHAQLLMDALRPVGPSLNITEVPLLLYGRIVRVSDAGQGAPHNVRYVFLEFNSTLGYKDFCIKITVAEGEAHRIDATSVGRIIIVHGRVDHSGLGIAVNRPKWGEVSLLSVKYEPLIFS